MKCQDCNERANKIMALRKERDTLRAELSDALERVGELTTVLKWIDESFNGRHRSPFEHMLQIAHKAQGALARPTLGAASRLRDEVLEEAAGIAIKHADNYGEGRDAEHFACKKIVDDIRARKSRETDR